MEGHMVQKRYLYCSSGSLLVELFWLSYSLVSSGCSALGDGIGKTSMGRTADIYLAKDFS